MCPKCGYEWIAVPYNRCRGQNVRNVDIPKGEKEIIKIFEKHNIKYVHEKIFEKCRNKNPLKFDFYLPSYNICIEYQGKQHYEPVDFTGKGMELAEENFYYAIENDNIKRKYCEDKKILLIEIPYWDFNNIKKILGEHLKIQ